MQLGPFDPGTLPSQKAHPQKAVPRWRLEFLPSEVINSKSTVYPGNSQNFQNSGKTSTGGGTPIK